MITMPQSVEHDELVLHNFSRMSVAEFKNRQFLGERFVIYNYTLSALIYTTTRPTKVHVARNLRTAILKGIPYTLISMIFGWWHIMGPIATIVSVIGNSLGGTDVSEEILEHIRKQDVRYQYGMG